MTFKEEYVTPPEHFMTFVTINLPKFGSHLLQQQTLEAEQIKLDFALYKPR